MNADPQAPGIRRLCVAVDQEKYSSLDGEAQARAQAGISRALRSAKVATGLAPTSWLAQPSGDGETAVLSPGINERDVIATFVIGLQTALRAENFYRDERERIRLRVAFHEGVIRLAEIGFAGRAAVTVNRLLDSAPVRSALTDDPATELALIVSQPIYDDHVGGEHRDFDATSFKQVHISMPSKDFITYAWLWVPNVKEVPAGIPEVSDPPTIVSALPAQAERPTQVVKNQVGRDQYNSARDMNFGSPRRDRDDRDGES